MDKVLSVLTFKSVENIFGVGGTQSWVLERGRAKACKYAVVCRNAHHPDVQGPEPHGSAFMIGKIKDVVRSTETEGRWLVTFSEYALGDFGDQWEGRNPVAYWTTDDYESDGDYIGVDFDALAFTPMPALTQNEIAAPKRGMTIPEAKAALAVTLGVEPSAIDIIVRG